MNRVPSDSCTAGRRGRALGREPGLRELPVAHSVEHQPDVRSKAPYGSLLCSLWGDAVSAAEAHTVLTAAKAACSRVQQGAPALEVGRGWSTDYPQKHPREYYCEVECNAVKYLQSRRPWVSPWKSRSLMLRDNQGNILKRLLTKSLGPAVPSGTVQISGACHGGMLDLPYGLPV